jgi:hypothetical protein
MLDFPKRCPRSRNAPQSCRAPGAKKIISFYFFLSFVRSFVLFLQFHAFYALCSRHQALQGRTLEELSLEAARASEALGALEAAMAAIKEEVTCANTTLKEVLETVKNSESVSLSLSESIFSVSERAKEEMFKAGATALEAKQVATETLVFLNEQVLPQVGKINDESSAMTMKDFDPDCVPSKPQPFASFLWI